MTTKTTATPRFSDTDTSTATPFAAPEAARGLEHSQINMYHTKGGTGFAAEDANACADRFKGKKVDVTGTRFEKNGADRIADGVAIQTKYYPKAESTVNAAFDSATGQYRYEGQVLEVPKDQYEKCVAMMREKIAAGKVPGVTDPNQAEQLVKKGSVTYKQAKNIARAGNIDSLMFDAKTQSVTSGYVFAISFAVDFACRKRAGAKTEDAIRGAIGSALAAGGTALVTGIVAAQVLRTRAAALGVVAARNGVKAVSHTTVGRAAIERLAQASLGRAVYGAAAVNHVAKLLRSNVITSVVATAVTSAPDFYRAAFSKNISWPQFTKSLLVNAGGVAGGTGGWLGGAAAGAAMGSVVPIVGTAAGAFIGGLLGAFGGGWLGTKVAKGVMDALVEDDAKRMIDLLRAALEELAGDYLLTEAEIGEISGAVKAKVDAKWLRAMYQAGHATASDNARRRFAYDTFEPACEAIAAKRPPVKVPAPEQVHEQLAKLAEEAAEQADDTGSREDDALCALPVGECA